jgi:hypothetical protein
MLLLPPLYRSVDDFCQLVTNKVAQDSLASALRMVVSFVEYVISQEQNITRVLSSKDLDHLCLELGNISSAEPVQYKDRDHTVYLVTELYKTGGHTRVLRDLICAEPAGGRTMLVSNILESANTDTVLDLFEDVGADVRIAPPGDMASKLYWLQEQLRQLSPRKTYMLIHHYDAVSVAAAQKQLVGQLNFFHNCDHRLGLGIHIPHAKHIDFHAKGFYHCRESEGIVDNVICRLTVEDGTVLRGRRQPG